MERITYKIGEVIFVSDDGEDVGIVLKGYPHCVFWRMAEYDIDGLYDEIITSLKSDQEYYTVTIKRRV